MAKQCCGTCKFWDRGKNILNEPTQIGTCRSDIQYPVDEWPNTFQEEGQDCPVYKKIKEEK